MDGHNRETPLCPVNSRIVGHPEVETSKQLYLGARRSRSPKPHLPREMLLRNDNGELAESDRAPLRRRVRTSVGHVRHGSLPVRGVIGPDRGNLLEREVPWPE